MPTNEWTFYIAGVQFHQAKNVMSELSQDFELGLFLDMEPEPTNKYDSNAVKLTYTSDNVENVMLGYVPSKLSAKISAFLELAENPVCEITELNPSAKTWEQIKVTIKEG